MAYHCQELHFYSAPSISLSIWKHSVSQGVIEKVLRGLVSNERGGLLLGGPKYLEITEGTVLGWTGTRL